MHQIILRNYSVPNFTKSFFLTHLRNSFFFVSFSADEIHPHEISSGILDFFKTEDDAIGAVGSKFWLNEKIFCYNKDVSPRTEVRDKK